MNGMHVPELPDHASFTDPVYFCLSLFFESNITILFIRNKLTMVITKQVLVIESEDRELHFTVFPIRLTICTLSHAQSIYAIVTLETTLCPN